MSVGGLKNTQQKNKETKSNSNKDLELLRKELDQLKLTVGFFMERIHKTGAIRGGDYHIFQEMMLGKSKEQIEYEVAEKNQGRMIR